MQGPGSQDFSREVQGHDVQGSPPRTHTYIQDAREWVDQGLTFIKQATYLRERSQARLVMKVMTRTHAGTTYPVLCLFYGLGVRALINYSEPVLFAVSPT